MKALRSRVQEGKSLVLIFVSLQKAGSVSNFSSIISSLLGFGGLNVSQSEMLKIL